jgi:uncharacterized protein YjbI with pentapeptide repeats
VSDCIRSVAQLTEQISEARRWAKPGRYFLLGKPVCLNAHLERLGNSDSWLETQKTYEPPDLHGIDFSEIEFSGDLRGVNAVQAVFRGAKLINVNLSNLHVHENSQCSIARDANPAPVDFLQLVHITGGDEETWEQYHYWFGVEKSYPTQMNGVTLEGAILLNCALDGAQLTNSNVSSATFKNCTLQNANFAGSNLRGTKFIACTTTGMNIDGCQRLNADQPLDTHGSLEFLLNVASTEAIAALTNLTLLTQQVRKTTAIWLSLLFAGLYVFFSYSIEQQKPIEVRGFFRRLSAPIMCLLAIEAALALFQMVFDPNIELPPSWYVVIVWVFAGVSLLIVRWARFSSIRLRFLFQFDDDVLVLILIPLAYMTLYVYMHQLGRAGLFAVLLTILFAGFLIVVHRLYPKLPARKGNRS